MPSAMADPIRDLAKQIFVAHGVSSSHAQIVVDHLVDSNLAGHDSHGILRVPQYVDAVHHGQVNVDNQPQIISKLPAGATVDGGRCFGQVAAVKSMEIAVDLAAQAGIAAVTLSNAYHTGRLGAYTEQAAKAGMIGMVMVNAGGGGQSVTPFGGRARRLATNPLSIAAPWHEGFPVMIDMATCVAPEGKVRLYKLQGRDVPSGWLIDGHGNPTVDPNDFYADPPGAILPLGGQVGYKGFGLSVMVELLTGALAGGGVCTNQQVPPVDNMLLVAIDVHRYGGSETYQQSVASLVDYIRETPRAPGIDRVYAPGEKEFLARKQRTAQGFEVDAETWAALTKLAGDAGVPMPDAA